MMMISDRPLIFWSWNDGLAIPELLRQLRGFAEAGIGGCFLHARAGLRTPYLGKEWLACCRAVCAEAQQLGLDIYLYDENGWPSGFGNGQVPAMGDDYCQKAVFFTRKRPAADTADRYLLAAYAADGADFTLVWQAGEGDRAHCPAADLYAECIIRRGYADLTYPPAVDAFIESTHERYAAALFDYFGTVIRGLFTDEPQLSSSGIHFGCDLSKRYAERTGHDLLQDLWRLACPGTDGEETARVRHSYYALLEERFDTVYFSRIGEWCTRHGLVFTGHMAAEDGLLMQLPINGSVMPHYRHFTMPGIDHLGRRYAPLLLLKQVQSVAAQTGRERVLAETFGCSGWNLSFADITRIWGWLSINGVTTPCLHLSPYSLAGRRKRDYPPAFSEQAAWWPQMRIITDWFTRVGRFFAAAERHADILVLSPMHDLWRGYAQDADTVADLRPLSAGMRTLIEGLRDIGLDFDIGDETILAASGAAADGRLTVGRGRYSLVVVPECRTLEPDTVRLLAAFAAQGGRVLYIGRRPVSPGLPDGDRCVGRADMLNKFFCSAGLDTPFHLTNNEDAPMTGINTWLGHRADGGMQIALYPAYDRLHGQETVELQAFGYWTAALLDPLTGEERQIPVDHRAGDTRLPVTLAERQLTLLTLTPAAEDCPPPQPTPHPAARLIPLCWTLVRTAPNAMTLDEAALSIDGAPFGAAQPIHRIRETVAALPEDGEHRAELAFAFTVSPQADAPLPLSLGIERDALEGLWLDGAPLPLLGADAPHYVDRAIAVVPLGAVSAGVHRLTACYRLETGKRQIDADFETLENCFCPRWEPECVYLLGEFTADAALPTRVGGHYRVCRPANGGVTFTVAPPRPLHMGELTAQGLWFYCGAVRATAVLPKLEAGQQVFLRLTGLHVAVATVQVGDGARIPVIDDRAPVPLTGLKGDGTDLVTLTLYGSDRDLFGPHHHRAGELFFIGGNSFAGVYDWTDEFMPNLPSGRSTWDEAYSFVRFGAEDAALLVTG